MELRSLSPVFDGPSRYRETYGGSCGQPPARRQSGEPTKLMLVGQTGPGRGQRQVVWAPALLWLVEHHPRRSRAGASRRGSARCGHAKTEPFRCCGIRGEGAPCGRQPGLVRRRMGVSQQSGAVALASNGSSLRATRPSNKGMKQTSVERIGRSQLIPGVLRTSWRKHETDTARSRDATLAHSRCLGRLLRLHAFGSSCSLLRSSSSSARVGSS